MSRPKYTRRTVIAAVGSAIATGTFTIQSAGIKTFKSGSGSDPYLDGGPSRPNRTADQHIVPDAITARNLETIYPLATYNNRTGWYDVTMPVNVRFDLTGSAYGMAAIEEPLRARNGWTQVISAIGSYWPDSDAKPPDVWDPALDRLVAPIANYRKPIGPLDEGLCYHVYLWPVRVAGELVGVAAQAHKDAGSVRDHIATDFAEAATELTSLYEVKGWTVTDADFDFDVDAGLREFWEPTGDRIVTPFDS